MTIFATTMIIVIIIAFILMLPITKTVTGYPLHIFELYRILFPKKIKSIKTLSLTYSKNNLWSIRNFDCLKNIHSTFENLRISIGCKYRSIEDWDKFFNNSDEVINTKRNTLTFKLLKFKYKMYRKELHKMYKS